MRKLPLALIAAAMVFAAPSFAGWRFGQIAGSRIITANQMLEGAGISLELLGERLLVHIDAAALPGDLALVEGQVAGEDLGPTLWAERLMSGQLWALRALLGPAGLAFGAEPAGTLLIGFDPDAPLTFVVGNLGQDTPRVSAVLGGLTLNLEAGSQGLPEGTKVEIFTYPDNPAE